MKKILLIAALFVTTLSVSAQTEKGKWLLGGSAAVLSSKANEDADSETSFKVVPYVGYFINNNFALGLGIGYQEKIGGQDLTTDVIVDGEGAFVVEPFGRYYAKTASDNFKFFGQLSVPLAFGDNITQWGVRVSPGFAFFPTKKVALELALNGISYDAISDGGPSVFTIGTNFFAPRLGIVFHLGGK